MKTRSGFNQARMSQQTDALYLRHKLYFRGHTHVGSNEFTRWKLN